MKSQVFFDSNSCVWHFDHDRDRPICVSKIPYFHQAAESLLSYNSKRVSMGQKKNMEMKKICCSLTDSAIGVF